MKLGIFAIASVATLLTACGVPSAASSAASAPKPPSIRSVFLNYVPIGEQGAPHDLEWLVEHAVGDGGYYGTKYFPGTLTIIQDKKHMSQIDISNKQPLMGNEIYYITWNINGVKTTFLMGEGAQFSRKYNGYKVYVPTGKWFVIPSNYTALYAYSQ